MNELRPRNLTLKYHTGDIKYFQEIVNYHILKNKIIIIFKKKR